MDGERHPYLAGIESRCRFGDEGALKDGRLDNYTFLCQIMRDGLETQSVQ